MSFCDKSLTGLQSNPYKPRHQPVTHLPPTPYPLVAQSSLPVPWTTKVACFRINDFLTAIRGLFFLLPFSTSAWCVTPHAIFSMYLRLFFWIPEAM